MFNKENISIIYEKWLPVPSVIIKRVFPDPCWTCGVITLGRIPYYTACNHEEATFDKRKSFVFFPLISFSRSDGCPHPEVDLLNTCFEESFMHKLATRPIVKYIWQSINTSDGWQNTRLKKPDKNNLMNTLEELVHCLTSSLCPLLHLWAVVCRAGDVMTDWGLCWGLQGLPQQGPAGLPGFPGIKPVAAGEHTCWRTIDRFRQLVESWSKSLKPP